jgi:hypothetical protein
MQASEPRPAHVDAQRAGLSAPRNAVQIAGDIRERLRRVDWGRINHILIPERYWRASLTLRRMPWWRRPAPSTAPLLWRGVRAILVRQMLLMRSLTRLGAGVLAVTSLFAIFGLSLQRSSVYILFAAAAALLVVSVCASQFVRSPSRDLLAVLPPRVVAGSSTEVTLGPGLQGASAKVRLSTALPIELSLPLLPYFMGLRRNLRSAGISALSGQIEGTFTLRPAFSGLHCLGFASMRTLLPFGLSGGISVYTAPMWLRVVPRVFPVHGLREALVRAAGESGRPPSPAPGGEFRGLRKYRPLDPVRLLSARASARAGRAATAYYRGLFGNPSMDALS